MRATVTIDRVEGGFVISGFDPGGETMDIARTWPEACEQARKRLLLEEKRFGTAAEQAEIRKLLGKEEEHA